MNLPLIIAILLLINALLHIIQGFLYGFNKKTIPVVIWGIVLGVLAYLWLSPVSKLVKWVTLIMPSLGAIILSTQIEKSTNAKWIDYGIIILDALTVGIMIYLLFIK